MEHKRGRGTFFLIILGILISSCFIAPFISAAQSGFEVDSVLLKNVIKSGSSLESQIRITNLKDSASNFQIKIMNLDKIASVKTENFELSEGESKTIGIVFSAINVSENVYVGSLEISSEKEKKSIPLILEVESSDVLFDSNINLFPKEDIYPGDEINAEIKIFDLSKIGISSVELSYFIKDFEGKTIVSETENIVVQDQTSITKSFSLPEEVKEGDFVFGVVLKYKNSIGISSVFFRVATAKFTWNLVDKQLIYFVLLLLFFIIIILIFVFYSLYSRDKFLKELRTQYSSEIRKQEGYLRIREKISEKALRTKEEKSLSRRIFRKIKCERRKAITEIHRERVRKIKQLRKARKKDEIKRQIEKWRKEGYDTEVLEKKSKIPSVNEIKRQIRLWKKKGYDISVLEKE